MTAVFEGFESFTVETDGGSIAGRIGGSGPPVLLLHGFPETSAMWHLVAPRLAREFTVVATDLRGYGRSGTPPSDPEHTPYSMRALATEQVGVMAELGFPRFALAGHDRGARCAYRAALDHPDSVSALAVLDIVPTADSYRLADARFAIGFWVWSFLAAPSPVPERLIAGDPDGLVDHLLDAWADDGDAIGAGLRDEYRAQLRDPRRVHAICEQYRAAATLDVAHDEADLAAGRRIRCPVLALWSGTGAVGQWYEEPLALWRAWADDVRGAPFAGGHFLPEEQPTETAGALAEFFRSGSEAQTSMSTVSPT